MKIDEYKQMMSFLLNPKHIHHGTKIVQGVPYVPKGYADGGRIGFGKGTNPEDYIKGLLRKFGDKERRVRRSQIKWLDYIKPMLKEYQETKNLNTLVGTNKDPKTFNAVASFKKAEKPLLEQLSKEIDIPVNELSEIQDSLIKRPKEEKTKYSNEQAQISKKQKYIEENPVGQRLNWIANNGKNYSDPNKMIDAYKKQFKVKNLSNDDLFKSPDNRIHLNNIDNLTSHSGGANDRMFYTPNYSEEEIFKASILQNNPEVQNKFKNIFKNIYDNFDTYKNRSIESLPNKIKNGNLLEQFDFIKPTEVKGAPGGKLSGIGQGSVRDSLVINAGINPDHLAAFSNIKNYSGTIESLLRKVGNLNSTELKDWNLTPTQAKKVSSQLNNFLSGQKDALSLVKDINSELSNKTFADIYGGVNFEHILSKSLAKDLDYLPKDYLLRGQFATRNFNMFKRDAFDFPLINMMQEYEKNPTKEQATKIQNFIDEFNSKTNNYANFKLNPKTKELEYLENKPTFDLSRYQEPGTAKNELLSNLKLGASEEFQKGFAESKYANRLKGLKLTPEIKKILNNLGLESKETEALFKLNNSLSFGLNPEMFEVLYPDTYQIASNAFSKISNVIKQNPSSIITGPLKGSFQLFNKAFPLIAAVETTSKIGEGENPLRALAEPWVPFLENILHHNDVINNLTPEGKKVYQKNIEDEARNQYSYIEGVPQQIQQRSPEEIEKTRNELDKHMQEAEQKTQEQKEQKIKDIQNIPDYMNYNNAIGAANGGRVHLKDGTQKYDIKDFIPNFSRDPIEDLLVNSIIASNDPKEVEKLYNQYKHYKNTYSGYGDYLKKTASQLATPEGAGYLLSKGLKGAVEGTEFLGGQALRTLGGIGEYDPSKSVYENLLYEPVAGEKLGLNKLIEKLEPKNATTLTKGLGQVADFAGNFVGPAEIYSLGKGVKSGIESLKETKDLLDPSKRDTLKIGAGIGAGAALSPIAKMFEDFEKITPKITPKKAPLLKVIRPLGETTTQFPEWFPSLINRIRKEGEMTPIYKTEKIPITEEEFMQKIKKGEGKDVYVNPRTEEYFRQNPNEYPYYKIKKTDDIIGYEYTDKNLPDVKITEYGGEEANVHFKNHYYQPVEINYKRPSFNNKGEFTVKDSVPEPGTGFEDVPDFEESHVSHLDEVLGGTGNLEKYATRSNKYRTTKGEAIVDEANAKAEAAADRIKDEESYGE
jgi:hypothetical protein